MPISTHGVEFLPGPTGEKVAGLLNRHLTEPR